MNTKTPIPADGEQIAVFNRRHSAHRIRQAWHFLFGLFAAIMLFAALPAWANPPISPSKSSETASPTSVPADGVSTSTITVTVRQTNNSPVSGATVTLAVSGGSSIVSPASAVTNVNGVATFTVKDSSVESVTYTATANSPGNPLVTILQTATVSFTGLTAPTVAKSFVASSIVANGTSTLSITLTNPNASAISGAAFNDVYPAGLKNAGTPSLTNTCGGTATAAAGGGTLTLSGGTIPASSFCKVTVSVTAATAGSYANSTGTVTSTNAAVGTSASATLTVTPVSASTSTVVASPASVLADGTSTSTITVTLKDAAGNPVSGKTVTLTAGSGSSTITTVSGTTNASGAATFTVKDSTAQSVTYTGKDTTDTVTITQTATVTFFTPPFVFKTFVPLTIAANGTSQLSIKLTNNSSSTSFTNVQYTDTYPAGLKNASTPLLNNGCSGTATAAAGGSSLALTGGSLGTSSNCTVSVMVTAAAAGSYVNSTGTVSTTPSSGGGSSSANLTVVAIDAAASTVVASPTSVAADGTTTSTITVTLVDGAGTGVSGKTVTLAASSGTSSTITTISGTTNASGVATFTVKDAVPQPVIYTATDTTDGITVTPTATVTFTSLGAPTVSKSFSPSSIAAGDASTLTITLTNANSGAITGVAFSDSYPANLSNTGSASTTCPAGTAAISGNFALGFSGGTIPALGSCTISVPVTATATVTNTTSTVTSTNATASATASGTLTVTPVSASKSTVVADLTSVPADGTSISTITVTLKDGASTGVSGKTVTLTAGSGSSTITTISGVTDSNGIATFTVKDTVAQAVTYTATDTTDGVTVTQTATVTFGASAANSTVVAVPTSVSANGTSTSTITVTLKDAAGNKVANKTVTLAAGSGSSTITTISGVTDSNGIATFTVKDTVAEAVTYTATDATDNSLVITQTATVTFGPSNTASTVVATPSVVPADGTSTSAIVVTLVDAAGNKVANKTVTLTAGSGSSTISTISGVTDSNGIATFTVKDTIAQTVIYTATDTTDNITLTQTASVTFGPSATSSTVVAVPTSVSANGTSTSTITVTLKDAAGNTVANKTVTLAAGSGSSTITTVSGVTDSNGIATFTVKDTVAQAVTYTATDTTDNNLTLTQTATVTFGPSNTASTVVAVPTSVSADGTSTSTITVTLKDAAGNKVANKTVALTAGSGSSTITTISGVTDSNGIATFTVKDTIAEAVTYTATDMTDNITITQTAMVTFGPSDANSSVVANPTSVPADGATLSTIKVILLDGASNPVQGKTVTLTAGSGSSTIITILAVTDSSGTATFKVKDAVAQSVTYTAKDTTDGLTLTHTATVTFTPVATITKTFTPATIAVNGTSTLSIKVVDTDAVTASTNVSLTDTYPAGLKNAATPALTNTCGGTPTATGGGSSLTLTGGTVAASSNCTVSVQVTAASVGSYVNTVTSGVSTGSVSSSATLTVVAVDAGKSTVKAVPVTVPADNSTTSTITVTLLDGASNPVQSKTVTLTAGSGSSTITTISGITNSSGIATFKVKDTVAQAVTYTATDTTDSIAITQTATVTFGPSAAASSVSANPTTVLANNSATSAITVTLLDGAGNPVQGRTVSLVAGSGSSTITTVSNVSSSSGIASFTVKDAIAETVVYTAIDTTDPANNITIGSVSVLFKSPISSFDAFDTNTAANATAGIIKTKIAGSPFTVDVIAFASGATISTDFTGTVQVEVVDSNNGSDCGTWQAITTSPSPLPSQTFSTADQGRHTVSSIKVLNAWKNARIRIKYTDASSTTTVSCSTDNFAIRPNTFNVNVMDKDWQTAYTTGTSRDLGNTSGTGGFVHKAGQYFTVQVNTVNAESTPATTSNYVDMPNIVLSTCAGTGCTSVCSPVCVPGGIFTLSTDASPMNAGVINSTTATYSEVGAFSLQLQDTAFADVDKNDTTGDCTATGRYICSVKRDVGRFVPDHFSLDSPTLTNRSDINACSASTFTYMGEPFHVTYSLQAKNATGALTANYAGTLARLDGADKLKWTPYNSNNSLGLAAISGSKLFDTRIAVSSSTGTWTSGVGSFAADVVINRDNTTDGPYANLKVGIAPQDADGVTALTTDFDLDADNDSAKERLSLGTTSLRYGRIKMFNAHGSELLDLPITLTVQYFNGTAFVSNTVDQCTPMPSPTNFKFEFPDPANTANKMIACSTAASLSGTSPEFKATLTKPGTDKYGWVDLTLNLGTTALGNQCAATGPSGPAAVTANRPWLQYSWSPTSSDPTARATFGKYKSGPIIYMREMY